MATSAQPTTEVNAQAIAAALEHYQLGELVRYWPAANGIENSNYFVTLRSPAGADDPPGGRLRDYVMTILEHPSNAGEAYVPLLDRLYACGLPVAPALRNQAGSTTDTVLGKPAMLHPRLHGRHVFNPTVRQVQALARFLARMHLATRDVEWAAPAYPRDPAWLAQSANRHNGYLPYTDQRLLEDSIERVSSMLRRGDVTALPKGVIHGDLFRDNALYNEWGLTGVVDFHHASTGYWIYDLAVAANDWCSDAQGRLDPDRTKALLTSYHAQRPLTRAELWFFPGFTLYAGLAFWLSRLNAGRAVTGARTKDPEEFRRIVQQHTRHFYYLDERLL